MLDSLLSNITLGQQLVVRKNMDVNKHERLSNVTLGQQLVIRKDMDVNEHERLSNNTLRNVSVYIFCGFYFQYNI
jgi:hypothetical protein